MSASSSASRAVDSMRPLSSSMVDSNSASECVGRAGARRSDVERRGLALRGESARVSVRGRGLRGDVAPSDSVCGSAGGAVRVTDGLACVARGSGGGGCSGKVGGDGCCSCVGA